MLLTPVVAEPSKSGVAAADFVDGLGEVPPTASRSSGGGGGRKPPEPQPPEAIASTTAAASPSPSRTFAFINRGHIGMKISQE